jgi:hypothetical protein
MDENTRLEGGQERGALRMSEANQSDGARQGNEQRALRDPGATQPRSTDSSRTLAAVRSRVLTALRNEDPETVERELPIYQQLLAEALQKPSLSPSQMMHMETEHHRFFEQVRASLLTMRIAIRLELERVRVSKHYEVKQRAGSEPASSAIDVQA